MASSSQQIPAGSTNRGTELNINRKAVGFFVGSQALTFVNMLITVIDSPGGAPVYGGIYENFGLPNTLLAPFNLVNTTKNTTGTTETLNFTTRFPFTMQAGNLYYFVLYSPVRVQWTFGSNPTVTGASPFYWPWLSTNGGVTWIMSTLYNVLQINVAYIYYTAVPGSITQYSRDQTTGLLTPLSPATVDLTTFGSGYPQRNVITVYHHPSECLTFILISNVSCV